MDKFEQLLAITVIAVSLVAITCAPSTNREGSGEADSLASQVPLVVERWHIPCDGTTPVEDHFAIPDEIVPGELQLGALNQLKRDIELLLDYSEEVARHVKNFTDHFRNKRFVDEQVIQALEIFDNKIRGYAEQILQEHPNFKSLDIKNREQVVSWVRVSVHKFSWVAAYMGLAKDEESVHEKEYFNHHFERTEEQVYWILCKLHRILYQLGARADNQLTHQKAVPENLKLKDNTVLRHQRDYLALRDYNRYMDQFRGEILSIKESGWRSHL